MKSRLAVSFLSAFLWTVGCIQEQTPPNRDAGVDARVRMDGAVVRTDVPLDGRDCTNAARADGGRENTIELCSDGCSNDGDRFADCDDFDCCSVAGVTCGPSTQCGRPRDSGTRDAAVDGPTVDAPVCVPGPENTAAACLDRCDNDGNRFADCMDFACCALVACGPSTSCARRDAGRCAAGPERTAPSCSDGCDNDSDALIDCSDTDCCDTSVCRNLGACRDASIPLDVITPRDVPMANEDVSSGPDAPIFECTIEGDFESLCHDECDGDVDGFADCADQDCIDLGECCERDFEETFERCTDGCDNDDDGLADCEEPECCGALKFQCSAGTVCGDVFDE